MSERSRLPISFEKGVFTYWEDSQVPPGALQALENWVPESPGGLRARVGWLNSSATGAPSSKRSRGLGYYVPSSGAQLLVATDDNVDSLDVYRIPYTNLSAGTWTLIEARAVTDRTLPVAFAAGAGVILYSHPGFASDRIRRWDGTTASDASTQAVAGQALAYHKNRFFSGGGDLFPSRVYFSELGDSTAWDASAGGTLFFDVAQDDGEPVRDFVTFDNGLIIAKDTSLWFLSGAGPDTFALHPLGQVDCAPGRSLIPTSRGVVIAGRDSVWFWGGATPYEITDPIHSSYSMTGNFMSGTFFDDVAYICDAGSGTVWAWDIRSEVWYNEMVGTANEGPGMLWSRADTLVGGTKQASTNSLVVYRDHRGPRARDANLSQTFLAKTGDIWIAGPDRPVTVRHLWLRLRQRGAGVSHEDPMTITVYGDGVKNTERIVRLSEDAGVTRHRIDLGLTAFAVRLEFSKALTSSEAGIFDIEQAELELDVEEPR